MGLEEYMTEEELRELNLGRLAGGVARGVGAVAGGAAGAGRRGGTAWHSPAARCCGAAPTRSWA